MVGKVRFELTAPRIRTEYSSRLNYFPRTKMVEVVRFELTYSSFQG